LSGCKDKEDRLNNIKGSAMTVNESTRKLVDEIFKSNGKFESNIGDYSAGIIKLEDDHYINMEYLKDSTQLVSVGIASKRKSNWYFTCIVDLEKKIIIDVVLETIEDPPFIE
jgi:hypothetical protein